MTDSSADHLASCHFKCKGCSGSMLIKMSEAAVSTETRLHLGYLSKYVLSHKIWKNGYERQWEGRVCIKQ